jgi:hypothetical protein
MAGVDLLVIKELGGQTLAMVTRDAHLSPGRLREGIDRLATSPVPKELRASSDTVSDTVASVGAVNDGTPEKVAMTITGHKTRSVFDRYHIVAPEDLRVAAARIASRTTPARGVTPATHQHQN